MSELPKLSPLNLARGMSFLTLVCAYGIGATVEKPLALGAAVVLALAYYVPARLAATRSSLPRSAYALPSVLAPLCLATLCHQLPHAFTLLMGGMVAMPLALGLVLPGSVLPPLCAGISSSAGGAFLWLAQSRSTEATVWVVMCLACAGLGAYATWTQAMLRKAELEAERERSRALAELAITQRRGAEAERLAVIGRLAAGVAHEINNPLAFLLSNLNWLYSWASALPPSPDTHESLDVLRESREGANRIHRIVTDLTAFSRQETSRVLACDAVDSVRKAMRIASVRLRDERILHEHVHPNLPSVHADPARLIQVVVNLLLNAADAVEEGTAHPRIDASIVPVNGAVHIIVEDNGPGISSDVAQRLFEPFFTTKPPGKGTGLGLSLSREYLQSFGASLEGSTRAEGGARFVVVLEAAVR